MIITYPAAR